MTLSRVAYFEHAAVASEQPLASLAGSGVLSHGGNAFDAAVATSFALAVTFHPAGGLGGDLFAMMYEAKTGRVHCLNSSGWSPSGLSAELVRSRGEKSVPVIGPYSAVVPGLVAGDLAMHRKFGTIGLRRLLAPAINYARKGFPAGEGICRSVAGTYDTLSPATKRVFAEDCGIMMSSRGAGFSLDGPNKVEPRKRPLHTLSAILLDRGRGPTLALGTSGGEYRPVQHTLFFTNIVDFSMSVEQSIDHPRFLWSGGRSLIAESGYERSGLSHYVIESEPHPGRTGVCHAMELLPRARKAVCDVRGDGLPAGY